MIGDSSSSYTNVDTFKKPPTQEGDVKEPGEGIVSFEQMANFIKESIDKSSPQIRFLVAFHDQNKHLSAEQINFIIAQAKKTVSEIEHEDRDNIDNKILASISSNLIEDSVDLAKIEDKECVFHFLKEKHSNDLDVSALKNVYFHDLNFAKVFSLHAAEVKLNSKDIAQIFEFLSHLKNPHDNFSTNTANEIFLNILVASDIPPDEKASYFRRIIEETDTETPGSAQIVSKFSLLKIEDEAQAIEIAERLVGNPLLLSSTIQHLGIKNEKVLDELFTKCFKAAGPSKHLIIENMNNFTGDNASLGLALIQKFIPSDPNLCFGAFLNKMPFSDEQLESIFSAVLSAAPDRKKRDVISQIGQINFKPETREKITHRMVSAFPEEMALSVSSMGLTQIHPSKRLDILFNLVEELKGLETAKIENTIKYFADAVRFLEFNDDESYKLAEHMLANGPLFVAGTIEAFKCLQPESQVRFCQKNDVSSLKDACNESVVCEEARYEIQKQSSTGILHILSQDFAALKKQPPEYLQDLCAKTMTLQGDALTEQVFNHTEDHFERAILLIRLSTFDFFSNLGSMKLAEEQKSAIIKQLDQTGHLDAVLNNIEKFDIKNTSTADYLIDATLRNHNLHYLIDNLIPLFPLYAKEDNRYAIALKTLQERPDFDLLGYKGYLHKLHLNTAQRISILIEASKVNPSFFKSIREGLFNQNELTSSELRAVLESALERESIPTLFDKTHEQWGNSSIISYLSDSDKDAIVTRIADKDWETFLAHAHECGIKGQTFISLAKKAQLSKDDSLDRIIKLALEGEGIIIASNIKILNIEDEEKREQIAKAIAQREIRDLIPFLGNFDLANSALLETFAEEAAAKDPGGFLRHIEGFQLNDEKKIALLEKIANSAPQIAAENATYVQFQQPEAHQEELFQIALTIYRADPSAIYANFKSLGLENPELVTKAEVKRVETLIEEGRFSELDAIRFDKRAEYLEEIGRAMLMLSASNPQTAYWTCNFLEHAAWKYQNLNSSSAYLDKALELRALTQKVNLQFPGGFMEAFDKKISDQKFIITDKASYNFGATFNWMDTQSLKGQNFRVRDVLIDGEEKRIVDFKVAYWTARDVLYQVNNLNVQMASNLIGKKVSVSDGKSVYYPFEGDSYNTKSPSTSFDAGPTKIIHIEGVGTIQVGNDSQWGSEVNKIKIILEKNCSSSELQQALSLLGLTSILLPSSEEDQKKLKINSIVHFFYPRFAAENDHLSTYHLNTTEDHLKYIRNQLGDDAVDKILHHLSTSDEHETLPGEKHVCLATFSEEAEMLGARATMCGIGYKKDFQTASEQLASIMTMGLLATQERYESGMIIAGASPADDFKENAADSVFLRLITQSAIDQNSELSTSTNLGGNIQIYPHVKVLNYMPYFHTKDNYGARNPESVRRGDFYRERPGALEFISSNQRTWVENNEVMLKKRLSPDHITLITYQDPRKVLVDEIEQAILAGTISSNLFDGCASKKDKAEKISAEPDKVLELLKQLPTYDAGQGTYKDFSIKNHWTIDPGQQIEAELIKHKFPGTNLMILEANNLSEIVPHLERCNSIAQRLQSLKEETLKVAGQFRVHDLSFTKSKNLSFINNIKQHLKTLNEDDLKTLLTPESLESIRKLKDNCNKHLISQDFSGQDSLNRELLTSSWNKPLHDPDVIIALFALAELDRRDPGYTEEYKYSTMTRQGAIELSIPECIAKGLEQHPIILEKLPLNSRPKTILSELDFMHEYIKRSDVQNTFAPVLLSIEKAAKNLTPEMQSADLIADPLFDMPYSQRSWGDAYMQLAQETLSIALNTDETKLLYNKSEYKPNDLRDQVVAGLKELLTLEKVDSQAQTREELIQTISQSIYVLDPKVSHLFFDRLHFLAALTCVDDRWSVDTSEGPFPIKDLFMGVMENLKHEEVSTTALVAEQFYIRLLMANETTQTFKGQK